MTTQSFNHIFIVTSTINTNLGLIDPNTRYQQTLETINSIRQKVDDVAILLVESSLHPLPTDIKKIIVDQVDFFLDLGSRNCLQLLGKNGVKGASELYILMVALDFIKNHNILSKRIFKISGRYSLTDQFDQQIYNDNKYIGKYIFRKRGRYHDNEPDCFLHTRFWSFDRALLDETYQLLSNTMLTSLTKNITIEEAIYQNINFEKLVELSTIHCQGYIAPWNQLIIE
jgi:hypothetical protein